MQAHRFMWVISIETLPNLICLNSSTLLDLSLPSVFAEILKLVNLLVMRTSIFIQSTMVCEVAFRLSCMFCAIVLPAERALDTMNFNQIRGRPCRIMWSQRDPSLRKSGEGNVFVKNLHKNITDQQLFDTFSVFGNILSCKVARNDAKESLEYGYVHYADPESAAKAIENV